MITNTTTIPSHKALFRNPFDTFFFDFFYILKSFKNREVDKKMETKQNLWRELLLMLKGNRWNCAGFFWLYNLKTLLHTSRNGTKSSVNLTGRTTQNKTDNSITSNLDVLERTQNMNLTTRQKSVSYCQIEKKKSPQTYVSAKTILVLLAFSIVNFVLPSRPAIRPIARAKWSPCKVLTSLISKVSKKISSNLNKAIASSTSKPKAKALRKSAPFCNDPSSSVEGEVYKKITSIKYNSLHTTAYFFAYLELNSSGLDIHSDLKLHVFN